MFDVTVDSLSQDKVGYAAVTNSHKVFMASNSKIKNLSEIISPMLCFFSKLAYHRLSGDLDDGLASISSITRHQAMRKRTLGKGRGEKVLPQH
jgi:hypothetical protein